MMSITELADLNAGEELTIRVENATTGKVEDLTGTVSTHPYADVHADWCLTLTDVTKHGTIRVAGNGPGKPGHVIIKTDGTVESRPNASRQIHIGDITDVVTPIQSGAGAE